MRKTAKFRLKSMCYQLAMSHLEMGKRFKDQEHLREAEVILAEIGAEFDLAQVRRLLQLTVEDKEDSQSGR